MNSATLHLLRHSCLVPRNDALCDNFGRTKKGWGERLDLETFVVGDASQNRYYNTNYGKAEVNV